MIPPVLLPPGGGGIAPLAGLSGGILVGHITTWSPAAWGYAETILLSAAVIIGGAGNRQRRLTEIMRALTTEPAVLLLDEPMGGVHPRLARQIGAQLLDLCASHGGARAGHHG